VLAVEAFKQKLPFDLGAGCGQHPNLLVGLAGVYFHLTETVESRSSAEENERRPAALVRICNLWKVLRLD
jgi:hypothetical protein